MVPKVLVPLLIKVEEGLSVNKVESSKIFELICKLFAKVTLVKLTNLELAKSAVVALLFT